MKYGGVELSYKNNSKVYHEADIRNDYRKLTKLLIEKNLTITTMESATSGQIASLITDTEGSSAVLKGAFVTYCNEAKIMQGVPAEVLDTYTVYSKETAEAMARVRQKPTMQISESGLPEQWEILIHPIRMLPFRDRCILQLE